jgi:uncharacterized hydrophobic protein (TIGR00271 family)
MERAALLEEIRSDVRPAPAYYVLAAASCAIASFGLLEDSAPVIIGAMLIAPLMTPIVALAFAIVNAEWRVTRNAAIALAGGSALAVTLSAAVSLVARLPTPGGQILSRGNPNLLDLGIALAAGAIAGYARVNRGVAETVGGAAIAVALMPPLCVVGIGISIGDLGLAYGAFLLFATNFVGITLACALVFVAAGLRTQGAHRGLITTLVALVPIAIPLGYATTRLIEQQQLEATLRGALLNDTQTFKRVSLAGTTIDWLRTPIRVTLLVRASNAITPGQVQALQTFAEARVHRPLDLVVEVAPIYTVVPPGAAPTSSAFPDAAPRSPSPA